MDMEKLNHLYAVDKTWHALYRILNFLMTENFGFLFFWIIIFSIIVIVTNFFNNLEEIDTTINQVLQGEIKYAFNDAGRFVINTTIGLFGLIDVASKMGLERHEEDFGQTLGVWGFDSGPYIMIPFLGPSNPRDL